MANALGVLAVVPVSSRRSFNRNRGPDDRLTGRVRTCFDACSCVGNVEPQQLDHLHFAAVGRLRNCHGAVELHYKYRDDTLLARDRSLLPSWKQFKNLQLCCECWY